MRALALAILAIGMVAAAGPSRAQTYDPRYPVCLHVYGPIGYYECRYFSTAQCGVAGSGRPAQCVTNPFFAGAYGDVPPVRRYKRHRADREAGPG